MPRSVLSVVIDKVISLVPVKIRGYSSGNEAEVTASGELKVDITSVSVPTVTANVNISDTAGNALTSTGNDLDVNVKASVLPTGASTAANQATEIASLATIAGDTTSLDAKVTACNTGAVVVASSALPTGAATETTLNDVYSEVSDINSKMTTGTDIGDVTVNNAAGAGAVNIQDGGNTITVDGTVDVASSALPTGAATSALQTSSEAILTTIDADTGTIAGDTTSIDVKTPSLGAALTAASVPVNIASDQDVPVVTLAPARVTSDLGAACIYFDHGTVAATFAADDGTPKTQSASYNLYITSIHILLGTEPTTELAIQPILLNVSIYDSTDAQWRYFGSTEIGGSVIVFPTPLLIAAGHSWYPRLQLGGATNLSIFVTVNGFEEAV